MTEHELHDLWTEKERKRALYDALRLRWDELLWPEGPDGMQLQMRMIEAWDAKYDAEKAFVEAVCQVGKQVPA